MWLRLGTAVAVMLTQERALFLCLDVVLLLCFNSGAGLSIMLLAVYMLPHRNNMATSKKAVGTVSAVAISDRLTRHFTAVWKEGEGHR